MDIIQISLCAYLIFASTYGAYYFAKNDLTKIKDDITLFDVLGNVFPSIIMSWFIFPYLILDKIVIHRRTNKRKS